MGRSCHQSPGYPKHGSSNLLSPPIDSVLAMCDYLHMTNAADTQNTWITHPDGNESFHTGKRVYHIWPYGQGFDARFRVINKKTGQEWQASRHVQNGRDAHMLSNHYQDTAELRMGSRPEDWTEGGKWNSVASVYSTREVARAAVEKHAQSAK